MALAASSQRQFDDRQFVIALYYLGDVEDVLGQQSQITFSEMPYKQAIKAQIKRAVKRFNRNKFNPSRTPTIEHRLPKKKYMRRSFNYYQRRIKSCTPDACHVLNFYNILAINETAIRDPAHDESFVKTHFYYKNMKRIEATDHYFICFLEDNPSLVCPVGNFIARYKKDPDPRFQRMGVLLEDIEKRLEMQRPSSEEPSTLEADAEAVMAGLGKSPFIGKIGSDRLVISRSMMELFGYDTQEFIIECMKFRVPLFEYWGFACDAYYETVMKNLENVLLLMDLLAGRIPLDTFRTQAYFQFKERVFSKRNREYLCRMSLSMPVPLMAFITVEEVLETREKLDFDGAMRNYHDFKAYVKQVREKEFETLQHLVALPNNSLPHNKPKVADYLPLKEEDSPNLTVPLSLSPEQPRDSSSP